MATDHKKDITIALAWCLAWGTQKQPQYDISLLQEMRQAIQSDREVPTEVRSLVEQVKRLQNIDKDYFPETIQGLQEKYPELWNQQTEIGLVYGGATKIKQYVFEAAKLPDIRGASALLDRINLIDLPAFFGKYDDGIRKSISISQWLRKYFVGLESALIPELLIYYKGGNVLAFCPKVFADDLANAIERRYTEETLTANSCAVSNTFKLLEIRFGLLNNSQHFWLDAYLNLDRYQGNQKQLIEAYFGNYQKVGDKPKSEQELRAAFSQRKNFNELVTNLAIAFNRRRAGNITANRSSRAYPPIFETHPYLVRDESDRRPAVFKPDGLPDKPNLSESLARKRLIGQITKREIFQQNLPSWYTQSGFNWQPIESQIDSWVKKFEDFLEKEKLDKQYNPNLHNLEEARSLREISNASDGFVAYIYADGNNMGGYIQKQIRTPEDYQQFSEDIFNATEKSVYLALTQHIQPIRINPDPDSGRKSQGEVWIHPFEIITIGGDDVLLIVPANKALEVAKTISEKFEEILVSTGRYQIPDADKSDNVSYQRYCNERIRPLPSQCLLSTSIGVLITADDTPIYYADKLVSQLLKSAKEKAKSLKDVRNQKGDLIYSHFGGTVDFLSMKSVTMISSNIKEFRKEGLTKKINKLTTLKLYAVPYTLYELGGLIEVVKALKKAKFPKSQLYQIRSLLENGKQTAILNYRYFRVRLQEGQAELKREFEEAWCKAKTNEGNLAPWMYDDGKSAPQHLNDPFYETIWRDIVDIYDFIDVPDEITSKDLSKQEVQS